MDKEKEDFVREKLLKEIIEQVSFGELVKIVHSLANKEVDEVIKNWSEEEKEGVYQEILNQSTQKEDED